MARHPLLHDQMHRGRVSVQKVRLDVEHNLAVDQRLGQPGVDVVPLGPAGGIDVRERHHRADTHLACGRAPVEVPVVPDDSHVTISPSCTSLLVSDLGMTIWPSGSQRTVTLLASLAASPCDAVWIRPMNEPPTRRTSTMSPASR